MVLDIFQTTAEIGTIDLGAHVMSMSMRPSDVLTVKLLLRECLSDINKSTLRVVPLLEPIGAFEDNATVLTTFFSNCWYLEHL